MKSKIGWITCLALLALCPTGTVSLEYAECIGAAMDVYVASHSSCAKYIYCAGASSFEAECFAQHFYDEVQERCMEGSLLDRCKAAGEQLAATVTAIEIATISTTATKPPQAVNTKRPVTTQIVITKRPQSSQNIKQTMTTPMPTNAPTPPLLSNDFCPVVDTLANVGALVLPNVNSCTAYIVCYQGVAIPMACERGLRFSAHSGRCVPAHLVSCPQSIKPVRAICRRGVYDYMPHEHNCAYFYYCSNGYRIIHRCPQDYTWNYERRSCVQHAHQKCYNERFRRQSQRQRLPTRSSQKFVFKFSPP